MQYMYIRKITKNTIAQLQILVNCTKIKLYFMCLHFDIIIISLLANLIRKYLSFIFLKYTWGEQYLGLKYLNSNNFMQLKSLILNSSIIRTNHDLFCIFCVTCQDTKRKQVFCPFQMYTKHPRFIVKSW